MPTVSWNKFNCFVEDIAKGVHNLATGTLTVALTNTAPSASTDTVLADISEVSYANCSSRVLTTTSCVQTAGTLKLILQDLTLTATGAVGPFQWIVIYNDTPANDNLIGFYNYGSAVTMAATDTLPIDLNNVDGIFTIA